MNRCHEVQDVVAIASAAAMSLGLNWQQLGNMAAATAAPVMVTIP